MGPWCGQMGAGGWLSMIAFWVVVVVAVVWGVSRLFPAPPATDARSILDARLAAGEIDPATYRAVREELAAQAAATTSGGRP
ncbi:hypothetical protein GCM10010972_34630 [Cellulomonas carbonis]|nr:hypothetical protein GCM10010972_34630 [Cellulomonas carbonis]